MGAPSQRPQTWEGWCAQHHEFAHGPSLDIICIIVHATDIPGHFPHRARTQQFVQNPRHTGTSFHHTHPPVLSPCWSSYCTRFRFSRPETWKAARCKEIGARGERMYPPSPSLAGYCERLAEDVSIPTNEDGNPIPSSPLTAPYRTLDRTCSLRAACRRRHRSLDSLGRPAMQNPLDPSFDRQKEREKEMQQLLPTVASLQSGAIRQTTRITECQPRGA